MDYSLLARACAMESRLLANITNWEDKKWNISFIVMQKRLHIEKWYFPLTISFTSRFIFLPIIPSKRQAPSLPLDESLSSRRNRGLDPAGRKNILFQRCHKFCCRDAKLANEEYSNTMQEVINVQVKPQISLSSLILLFDLFRFNNWRFSF